MEARKMRPYVSLLAPIQQGIMLKPSQIKIHRNGSQSLLHLRQPIDWEWGAGW